MNTAKRNEDTVEPLVRLWLVVSEDRGMGVGVESGHATEDEANGCCGSNCFVTCVDIPIARIDCLVKPNARLERSERSECTSQPSCSTCVHFGQAKPYRWGLCKHPLPWWVLPISPNVHPEDNNAKDCDCYSYTKHGVLSPCCISRAQGTIGSLPVSSQ
jgi:hypothetical protein